MKDLSHESGAKTDSVIGHQSAATYAPGPWKNSDLCICSDAEGSPEGCGGSLDVIRAAIAKATGGQ